MKGDQVMCFDKTNFIFFQNGFENLLYSLLRMESNNVAQKSVNDAVIHKDNEILVLFALRVVIHGHPISIRGSGFGV